MTLFEIVNKINEVPDSIEHSALSELREMVKECIDFQVTLVATKTITLCPLDFGLDTWPDDPAKYVQDRFLGHEWEFNDFTGEETKKIEVKKV